MGDGIPSKMEILSGFFQLQQEITPLFFSSESHKNRGNLRDAVLAYDQLISLQKQQLELAELNNRHYPDSPFDIQPIVSPLLNAMLVQADVFEALGNLDSAELRREETIQISEKYLSQPDQAERERQRAASLISQGRFNQALVALTNARDTFREQEDLIGITSTTANIAGIFEWLGDYDRALQEVEQASRDFQSLSSGKSFSQDEILSNLIAGQLQSAEKQAKFLQISLEIDQIRARANRYLGNFAKAESQFRLILSNVPDFVKAGIEFQLAATLIDQNSYQEGLAYLDKLEPAFKGLLRSKLGVLLSYKAEALLGLCRPDQALECLDQAIEDLSRYQDPDSLWKTQWRRARALEDLKRPIDSLNAYVQTIDTINGLRKAPLGYRLDSTYLKDKLPVFNAAIDLACEQREAEVCCRFMELIKSRILTATMSIPEMNPPENIRNKDPRIDELSGKMDALEYQAYRVGWSDELVQHRAEILSKRAELIEQIRFSDPRWRTLSEPVPFDLDGCLALLAAREQAALTLFYQPHQIISVQLKDGKCKVAKIPVTNEAEDAIHIYLQNVQNKPKKEFLDPSVGLNLNADHLIPAELLNLALQASSLVIVPHGPLHLLPWAGLMFDGKRLFEYCPVGMIPNLSCLLGLQVDFSSTPTVGLIGAPDYGSLPLLAPLYMVAEELLTIQDIYASSEDLIGEVMLAEKATEANFWQLAHHEKAAGNIFHIACHGTFVTGDPLNSGLLLTNAKVDAAEIARTHLRYDEVVLSACSTGYRPTDVGGIGLSGDDILGLPGALLEAGVRSILVSIPRAREDIALMFMTLYHEHRSEGLPPMMALQETQKSMLSNAAYPPYLWIGFTVYGCQ